MSDPIPVPDDGDTGLRARRLQYSQRAVTLEMECMAAIQVVAAERDRLRADVLRLGHELALALSAQACAEENLKLAQKRISELEAVAEAAKTLAIGEGWTFGEYAGERALFSVSDKESHRILIADALVAAGYDWRERDSFEPPESLALAEARLQDDLTGKGPVVIDVDKGKTT